MKTVRFEDAADEELIDEIVRYELRREGLGTEFLSRSVRRFGSSLRTLARGKHRSTDAMSVVS